MPTPPNWIGKCFLLALTTLIANARLTGQERVAAGAPAAQPTPDAVINLWPGDAPNLVPGGRPEKVVDNRHVDISVPQLYVYLPPKDKATGAALILCPGGGYSRLGLNGHVQTDVKLFHEHGIAVFALKYRTRYGTNSVAEDALADGKRAVRIVRSRAGEWGVDTNRIGVQGYSAGANLCLNLAGRFDEGDPKATDAIERFSSRPDFVALMCPWPNGKKIESYPLFKNSPPTFIAHAKDDKTAPVAFGLAIDQKLKDLGVVEELFLVDAGGHMAFHHSVSKGPGAKWPEALMPWLKKIGMLK